MENFFPEVEWHKWWLRDLLKLHSSLWSQQNHQRKQLRPEQAEIVALISEADHQLDKGWCSKNDWHFQINILKWLKIITK